MEKAPVKEQSDALPGFEVSGSAMYGSHGGTNSGTTNQDSPPKYLVQSILCILFCCWPFAVVCLVKGSKIDGCMARGEYGRARELSGQVKNWLIASFVTGIVLNIIVMVFSFVYNSN
jgi:hypothetical protein